jgi:hypothetical protein
MAIRQGEFATTNIFSLNNFHGEEVISQRFSTPFTSIVPILVEFNHLTGADPAGSRHLTSHPSFVQILGSGSNTLSVDLGPLDFSATNISKGSGTSFTRCFIFRVEQFDCSTSRVTDMKVWAPDTSDFLTPESFRIVYETRQSWPSGFQFGTNAITQTDKYLPFSLPDAQNLFRQDGGATIFASGDADVSEYVVMSVAASGTLPLGEYGSNLEGFQIRVTYDLDNIPLRD